MLRVILILSVFIQCFLSLGQKMDLKFEGLTIQDGLSSNVINDIIRDSDGFMWVATEDGVNRYDGLEFKTYREREGDSTTLCSNLIYVFLKNHQNNLLVGSSKGLNIYNSKLDRFDKILEGVEVRDIIEYSKGGYMIASSKGLIQLDDNFIIVNKSILDKEDAIALTCVFEDSQKRLWLGSFQRGLYLMNSVGSIESFNIGNGRSSGNLIRGIIENHKHEIMVATADNGIVVYSQNTDVFEELSILEGDDLKNTIAIYEDEGNHLWVGTIGSGLAIYNWRQKKYETYTHSISSTRSITDDVITSIYSDKRGGIWLGSHNRGVVFFNKYSANFKHVDYLPSFHENNIVSAFKKDKKGNLWVATDGGGIVYYDFEHHKNQSFVYDSKNRSTSSLSSNSSLALEIDDEEKVWVGSYQGGVDVYDPQSNQFTHYRNNPKNKNSLAHNIVWNIYKDSKGRMWICTRHGISLYQPETDDFVSFTKKNTNLKGENIRMMLEIDSTHFYVATTEGFSIFDFNKKSFKTFVHELKKTTSISSSFVLSVVRDSKDRVWVGTYGGGVNLFNPKLGTFRSWKEENGLSNNYVCGILPDSRGNLWIPTQHGLSRFNIADDKFQNFYYADGLQGDKFSIGAAMVCEDGEILIGGINGYNSFVPSQIMSNNFPPPLYFTDFKIFNQSVDLSKKNSVLDGYITHLDKIELSYDQNMITFFFAALNFIQSDKNNLSFFMEGFDKEWSEPSNVHQANYTNLSPGKYVFRVKAANNHGVWNKKELSISVIIYPPFWKTWWFNLLLLTLVVLVLYFGYMYRIKSVIDQKNKLEKEVKNRTEVIFSKNRELEDKEIRHIQSLNYARLIQTAVLPPLDFTEAKVKDMFVFFRPSEIVSGDFYWFNHIEGKTVICAVDCTGHGVPGAFLSMMGKGLLDTIVLLGKEFSPSQILEDLHQDVVRSLRQKETKNADGMDVSIVVIDHKKKEMKYAGAMNPLLYFQNGKMTEIKGNRRHIGGVDQLKEYDFDEHLIDITTETVFYLYSDGYQDQFGGERGKKYMIKRFRNLLNKIHLDPLAKQKNELEEELSDWKGTKNDQTDDVLVIGCKV